MEGFADFAIGVLPWNFTLPFDHRIETQERNLSQGYAQKLVSTSCKWKVLKRKKATKVGGLQAVINRYVCFRTIGLFTDAKIFKDIIQRFLRRDATFASDFGEGVENAAEVFGDEVGTDAEVHGVENTLDVLGCRLQGVVMTNRGYDDIAFGYLWHIYKFCDELFELRNIRPLLSTHLNDMEVLIL